MIVWEFPCESRSLPGFFIKRPSTVISAGSFFALDLAEKWVVKELLLPYYVETDTISLIVVSKVIT
jgi:hypothetical protein